MSLYSIKDTTLTAIGDAIRAKNGSTDTYTSEQMAAAIQAIVATGGGGAGEIACYEVTGTASGSLGYAYDLTPYMENDFFYLNWIRATSTSVNDYYQVFIYHAADGSIETAPFGYNPMTITSATAAKTEGTFVDGILTLEYLGSSYKPQSTGYVIVAEGTGDGSGSGGITPEGELAITENGTYDVTEYASALVNVASSGAEVEPIVLTGDCGYACAGTIFNAVYGKVDISTEEVTGATYMFNKCSLSEVDFDINVAYDGSSALDLTSMFRQSKLRRPPYIRGDRTPQTGNYSYYIASQNMFHTCTQMVEIPYDYFHQFGGDAHWESAKNYTTNRGNMFNSCESLRALPDLSNLVNKASYSGSLYYNGFPYCHVLDEIVDLPVYENVTWTSNAFNNTFNYNSRLKRLTFATNEDGTPKTASGWKSQTIDLSSYVGFASLTSHITNHSDVHGIDETKRVTDLSSYEALKDDPDWWTTKIEYSRYNHDSAVETINSLPDVSASGGTNTIKFKGTCGSGYGKAISDLTDEEKAVATAKGWTVTIV